MICSHCGTENPDGTYICLRCGQPTTADDQKQENKKNAIDYTNTIKSEQYNQNNTEKALSMWEYFGYNILFAIPLVGFICMVIFACSESINKNLKNYAIALLVYAAAGIILMLMFIGIFIFLGISIFHMIAGYL